MVTNLQDVWDVGDKLWISLNKLASQPLITFSLGGVSTLLLREFLVAQREKRQGEKLTKETLAKLALEVEDNLKRLKLLQKDLENASERVRRYSASDQAIDIAIQQHGFQDHIFREHRATVPELVRENFKDIETVYELIDQLQGLLDINRKYDQGLMTNDHYREKKNLKLEKVKELLPEIEKALAMGNPIETYMLKPKI
jgi:CheY-like chemotaxis protein